MNFQLSSGKAAFPATYEQVRLLERLKNVKIGKISKSQLMKRMEREEAEELIEKALAGEEIIIE
jgi:TnpA family transposase